MLKLKTASYLSRYFASLSNFSIIDLFLVIIEFVSRDSKQVILSVMGFRVNHYFYFQFTVDPLFVLIEYVPYGDLLGYLRKSRGLNDTYFKDPDVKPQTNLTAEQLMRFAWQIADGMFYLSSRKVCVCFCLIISAVNCTTL